MHDILKFHNIHGNAIILSDGESVATRNVDYFSNAIVFSKQPIKLGQKVCIELTQDSTWSGALRLGVTTQDPNTLDKDDLPKYLFPDLTDKDGFWAKGIKEDFASVGNRITFYVNNQGQLHYFVNNEHKGLLLHLLPCSGPLWAVFDIYGSTTSARLVSADAAPVEIIARGPDAMQAYQHACESGTQPVFRTRLMLVGQDRVGKTTLKKSLMGLRANPDEESTDGIDLSVSCSFNTRNRAAWRCALHNHINHKSKPDKLYNNFTSTENNDPGEEYNDALATNIVQELLHKKHQKTSTVKEMHSVSTDKNKHKQTTKQVEKNTSKVESLNASCAVTDIETHIKNNVLLQELPERIVELVQAKLAEKEKQKSGSHDTKLGLNGSHVELNIWDFAGQAVYYTTHQVFLSNRAVYIFVFNLCQDLDTPIQQDSHWSQNVQGMGDMLGEFSSLDYMDYWMNSIHVHTSQNRRNSLSNTTLSPPIFIVGTHRNSLHDDEEVRNKVLEERFHRIKCFLKDKCYEHHVISQFYAVENNLDHGEDPEIVKLRCHIEDIASKESYMGEQIPLKWLRFEHAVIQLMEQGNCLCSLDQMKEVSLEQGISTTDGIYTLLSFYHDLGVLIYFGGGDTLDTTLNNTVILKPSWLVNMFSRVITATVREDMNGKQKDLWQHLTQTGILDDRLLDLLWKDARLQKTALLGLMDKFDLLCRVIKPNNVIENKKKPTDTLYFVPACVQKYDSPNVHLYQPHKNDVIFYLDFRGYLPDGLYHRIVTRCIRWSQEGGGHSAQLTYKQCRFFLDTEHDFVLEMADVHLARIKIVVLRVCDLDDDTDSCLSEQSTKVLPSPKPSACAKVRNFLETSLSDLRETWMKRISYEACVSCYCDKACNLHDVGGCDNQQCLHFLNLDQCITNKIVCCEHRRIKTAPYRKWFPSPLQHYKSGPVLPENVITTAIVNHNNLEGSQGDYLPGWIKSAAKLLNGGSDDQDWNGLARKLGYKKSKIEQFNEDFNPGLALLTDWIICSGNTTLSVDMLITFLEQMQRDDVVEVIQMRQEDDVDPPQVFLSYQWDHQDEVSLLRERLETAGYSCWMDIGQMGGGDHLYSRIDEGMRNSKLVIACLSPKYVVSHYCNREMHLADLLRKPVIPVLFEDVPWPPPGALALIFSQLIYITMKGVGGHGGSGIHADLEDKYKEIIQRVSCHAKLMQKPQIDTSPYHEIAKLPEFFHGEGSMSDISQDSPLFNSNRHLNIQPEYVRHSDRVEIIQNITRNSAHNRRSTQQQQQQQQHQQQQQQQQHRNTSARLNRGGASPTVEQVSVSNCSMCTIL